MTSSCAHRLACILRIARREILHRRVDASGVMKSETGKLCACMDKLCFQSPRHRGPGCKANMHRPCRIFWNPRVRWKRQMVKHCINCALWAGLCDQLKPYAISWAKTSPKKINKCDAFPMHGHNQKVRALLARPAQSREDSNVGFGKCWVWKIHIPHTHHNGHTPKSYDVARIFQSAEHVAARAASPTQRVELSDGQRRLQTI